LPEWPRCEMPLLNRRDFGAVQERSLHLKRLPVAGMVSIVLGAYIKDKSRRGDTSLPIIIATFNYDKYHPVGASVPEKHKSIIAGMTSMSHVRRGSGVGSNGSAPAADKKLLQRHTPKFRPDRVIPSLFGMMLSESCERIRKLKQAIFANYWWSSFLSVSSTSFVGKNEGRKRYWGVEMRWQCTDQATTISRPLIKALFSPSF
jgi:hypothetical protein